ncbi:sulfatase [Allorhodopirellula heiligendammensis]|uniref:Arylsulfatase n=1 Tax=Allorhodopirellula heiligendammensis TaxID=2714739 RepID=A0A5C6BW96_9BACT|nr:sulfatase [Allorhodopirellula heiligendammensis]TWU16268.1 Arylsulfatase [Allorhodopirellula heiligendammensis]
MIYRITLACLLLTVLTQQLEAASPRIVLILVDDLGWSDLGCYGHPYHRTPHIDALASQGIRFTDAYSPAPICSAARASILTGKAVPRLHFEFVTKSKPGLQKIDARVPLQSPPITLNLPLAERTIAERLRDEDYLTAFFGKWHVNQHFQGRYLAWDPKFGPQKQGFEVAVEDFGDHPYAWGKQGTPGPLPEGRFPTDSLIDSAADFLGEPHAQPFFAMVSLYHVHTPVKNRTRWLIEQYNDRIPRDAINRDQRLEYAAFVETLDHHVGTLLSAIDASGKADDTLVVFMSDNGGHPEFCSNAPLRGSKWNLYEGGIRVPLIARWPGKVTPESECHTPVIGYDLLPTFVEIAGGQTNDVDGESFASLLTSPSAELPRQLVWSFPYYHPETGYAAALDEIGINDFAVSKTRPQAALRRGNYKLLQFYEDERVELYDLDADISEQHDLSRRNPQLAEDLATQLRSTLDRMNARLAVPKP